MTETTGTLQQNTLVRDAARLQEALSGLIRLLQFRDRDRACCYGLSVSQCHALEALIQVGPMTVTQLGDHLYLEKSTASRLAKALLEKGLVRRRAPDADGRMVILQVTEAGHRMARKILKDLSEEYMDLLEEVDPYARAVLPQLIDRLSQTIARRTKSEDISCC